MSEYSIEDPWTSSASPSSRPEAASTSTRPFTWAPGGTDQSNATKSTYPTSEVGEEDSSSEIRLPELFERTWGLCRSAEQLDEVDISLGQLGKAVRCAQGLAAADVERVSVNTHTRIHIYKIDLVELKGGCVPPIMQIINLACASSSSHCTKQEFALALVLVAQVQGRQFLNVQQAKEILLSGIDLPEPILDLEKLSGSMLRSKLDPPVPSNQTKDTWEAARSDGVRTGLPLHASSTLRGFREDSREPSGTKSPLSAPVYIDPTPCSVHLLPDLGGYLFFRHVLYLVKTPLSEGVKRRYSDFVSLHEYLITRYPFRLVPPLPPKRLALPHMNRTQSVGSGQQDVFLEQRRLALARYSRNVISHPVFRKDHVVLSFYTLGGLSIGLIEENASTWKSPSVADGIVEEGLDESWKLSDSELMSVPVDMEEKLAPTRKMVGVVVDRWNSTVSIFERQVRRMEATAAESTRLSLSLSSLLEVESQTYQGSRIEDYFGQSTNLLIANSQDYSDLSIARFRTLQHTLDGLKNSRDIWLSLKELFKRHEKVGGDPIRDLTVRIEVNRKRWKSTIEEKKPNWKQICSKLKEEIELDQKLIEKFERRNKRVRVILWHEVTRLQQLENLVVADWKTFARSEAVNLAATKQAAEELVIALERLTGGK